MQTMELCNLNFKSPYKARYTLATKLNSTRSTLLKVDRDALAPYTLATKSTVRATKSTEFHDKLSNLSCCRFVAGFGNSRQCVPGLTCSLVAIKSS